jgi:hypothetical protein
VWCCIRIPPASAITSSYLATSVCAKITVSRNCPSSAAARRVRDCAQAPTPFANFEAAPPTRGNKGTAPSSSDQMKLSATRNRRGGNQAQKGVRGTLRFTGVQQRWPKPAVSAGAHHRSAQRHKIPVLAERTPPRALRRVSSDLTEGRDCFPYQATNYRPQRPAWHIHNQTRSRQKDRWCLQKPGCRTQDDSKC